MQGQGIKQIHNFRLIKQIGKGATATVFQAIDDKTNEIVAAKAIASEKFNNPRVLSDLKREIKLLINLNHNNIIKIVGVEKTSRNVYIIIEYCNGGNLSEYKTFYEKSKKCWLNELVVQKILRQLIKGLHYMHENHTVHRDIKLDNILLNFDTISNKVPPGQNPPIINYANVSLNDPFTVKIADLGYARELEGSGVASTICGTPLTMAPDVIALTGKNAMDLRYNNKADLWSLGAITYELWVGKPPFYANNYTELFAQVQEGNYTLPKTLKLSVEVLTFINGLLQFYPEKRMTWDQINKHPFIVNNVENFRFIDLTTIKQDVKDPKTWEINSKNCNNFLWWNFKNNSFNMELDKVTEQEITKPELKNLIIQKTTSNDALFKEIEEEKKRMKMEKEKWEKEKKQVEEMLEKAKELNKIAIEEKKNLEINSEKLKQINETKQKETNDKIKEEEERWRKEKEKWQNEKKEFEEERWRNQKIKDQAEKLIQDVNKIKFDVERQTAEIQKQKLMDEAEKKNYEKNEQKWKEEQLWKEKQHKEIEAKLKQEWTQLKEESNKLKNEVTNKIKIETELKEKMKEMEEWQKRIESISNEKDKKIMEIEKEKKEKEFELWQERQKYQEAEIKKQEEIIIENIKTKENELKKLEINLVEQCSITNLKSEEDEWEYLTNEKECEVNVLKGFEVIDNYLQQSEDEKDSEEFKPIEELIQK